MFINSAFAANNEDSTDENHATDDGHVTSEAGSDGQTHSETGTAHQGDYPGHFPPFDTTTYSSTLLWLAITFGVFFFLMSRIVIPRISSILEVRRDRISQDLEEANRMKEDSDAAHAAYEHELNEARNKANGIAAEAMEKAKAKADSQREKVEADLAVKLSDAEAKIADIKSKAMGEVDTIAADTVGEIVESMMGAKATKAEVTAAIKAVTAG